MVVNPFEREHITEQFAEVPFGSATLFDNRRVGPGSEIVSGTLDIRRGRVHTYGFSADEQGSWFIDVRFGDSGTWRKYAEGTNPPGPGSVATASFEENFAQSRARIRMGTGAGSVSARYDTYGLG